MLTRKHFTAIAAAFAETRPERTKLSEATAYNAGRLDEWHLLRLAIINVCTASNPAFDRARFEAATEE